MPGIRQDKFSRGQLEAALGKTAGAKAYAEEIGLIDWLKDRKSVTKSEVEQFVKENAPRLEEETSFFRDDGADEDTKFSDYQEPGGTNYREVLVKLPKNSANTSEIQALKQEAQSILEKRQALEAEGKYWDSNALSPEIGAINARIRKLQSQDNFKDPHFNEDNVLLHLRLNDRIDADGKKVLFIEELQSDWHQKGRKDGYGFNKKDYKIERNEVGNWNVIRLRDGEVVDVIKGEVSHGARKGEKIILGQAWEIFKNAVDAGILGGVPDAPFKKNWPALGLKRAIKEALEGGYDKVAWLDGEEQAARYDLSRQVDAIEVIRDGDGTYEIMARPDDEMGGEFQTLATKIPKEKLADYIGKEPAKKALEKMEDGLAHLEGLDLKVGGDGMKAFYDRELVSVANKISKKIGGGKVRRETRLEAGLDSQEFGSQVLDLPKNPQAVENLRLFMPAEKVPSDSRPPAILRDKQFMPAAYHGTPHTFKAEQGGAPEGKGYGLDVLKSGVVPKGLPKTPTIVQIARYFQERYGEPIRFQDSTPEKNQIFEDLIFDEVKHAIELHPEAAGWYDGNLKLAMSILESLDPSIKAPDNNFMFKAILAATSDGNMVEPQFNQTWGTYDNWTSTGKLSGDFVGGDRVQNIRKNLLRVEAIYKLMGGRKAGEWLSRKGSILEVRKAAQEDLGFTKKEAEKIGGDELVDEVVPYAIILGPKLGSFFNNLFGDYSTFTMDRWFMRTVGRNTGTQVVTLPPSRN